MSRGASSGFATVSSGTSLVGDAVVGMAAETAATVLDTVDLAMIRAENERMRQTTGQGTMDEPVSTAVAMVDFTVSAKVIFRARHYKTSWSQIESYPW